MYLKIGRCFPADSKGLGKPPITGRDTPEPKKQGGRKRSMRADKHYYVHFHKICYVPITRYDFKAPQLACHKPKNILPRKLLGTMTTGTLPHGPSITNDYIPNVPGV
jgi:hypothetical protein